MEHQYCLFYKNNKLHFGWIREVKKNRLSVVPENGKEFNCPVKQTEYIWSGKQFGNEQEAINYLSEKAAWVEQEVPKIDLEVIHELCEPGEAYSIDDLAENFLDEPENGWLRVALLFALKQNTRIFQQKKSEFFARSEEEIQKMDEEQRRKDELEARQQLERQWVENLLSEKKPEIETEREKHWEQFLVRVKSFLLYLDDSQEKNYFRELFQCNVKDTAKTENMLLKVLKTAGISISWGKLMLERASVNIGFQQNEVEAAKELSSLDILNGEFDLETVDLRHLDTYTVDNAETKDYDDALGWEQKDDGSGVVRIHIADVASYIKQNTLLFSKAEERISTLYTIKDIYPMFPEVLSEKTFSLNEAVDRPVMTFEIEVDAEGKPVKSSIYRSMINVNQNLSYQKVDEELEQENPFWRALQKFCLNLKESRLENGALELDRKEIKLDISDPEDIKIYDVRENTPATVIVQELAIYANYLAAKFCTDHDLPALFRNQPPYTIVTALEEGVKPQLKDLRIQPAHVAVEAVGHSALGLECYLQSTSPIRRFLDLICQGIIFHYLSKEEELYSEGELLLWAKRGEETHREYNKVERQLLDHWKMKYLSQHLQEEMTGEFMRYLRNGNALINLLEIQLVVEAPIDGLEGDQVIPVIIENVDMAEHRVTVRQKV